MLRTRRQGCEECDSDDNAAEKKEEDGLGMRRRNGRTRTNGVGQFDKDCIARAVREATPPSKYKLFVFICADKLAEKDKLVDAARKAALGAAIAVQDQQHNAQAYETLHVPHSRSVGI